MQVVLPEGSSDIEAFAPLPGVSQEQQTKYTYLDVFGRPVLVLRAKNVVALTEDTLLINYRQALAAERVRLDLMAAMILALAEGTSCAAFVL